MSKTSGGATQIIDQVDITEEISKYVQLRPNKQELLGLCPFHQEDTPSFYVNPHKKLFYCFGCQAGGNVISFRAKINGLTNLDAIIALAKDYNINLDGKDDQSPLYYQTLEKASNYYQSCLQNTQEALDYLKARNINHDMIKHFHIGYAKPDWQQLSKLPNINTNHLKTLGLMVDHPRGGYDRFRNRIIFPIISHHGKITGFGGRALHDEKPKYINSTDSPVYHKSDLLYGLYQVIKQQQKTLIVVEGYTDVITLHQAGVYGAVASLGTAFTLSHFQLASRYCEHIIFCFDGDMAGQNAQQKTFLTILPHIRDQVSCAFLALPKGEDPDSYIQKQGASAFKKQLQQATSFSNYLLNQYPLSDQSLESIAKQKHQLQQLIQQMPESVLKRLIMKEADINTQLPHTPQTKPSPKNKESEFINQLFLLTDLTKIPEDIQAMHKALPSKARLAWQQRQKDPGCSLAHFLEAHQMHYQPSPIMISSLSEETLIQSLSLQLIQYQLNHIDQHLQTLLRNKMNDEAHQSLHKLLKLKHLLKKKKIVLASSMNS